MTLGVRSNQNKPDLIKTGNDLNPRFDYRKSAPPTVAVGRMYCLGKDIIKRQ